MFPLLAQHAPEQPVRFQEGPLQHPSIRQLRLLALRFPDLDHVCTPESQRGLHRLERDREMKSLKAARHALDRAGSEPALRKAS